VRGRVSVPWLRPPVPPAGRTAPPHAPPYPRSSEDSPRLRGTVGVERGDRVLLWVPGVYVRDPLSDSERESTETDRKLTAGCIPDSLFTCYLCMCVRCIHVSFSVVSPRVLVLPIFLYFSDHGSTWRNATHGAIDGAHFSIALYPETAPYGLCVNEECGKREADVM
jgi:hypothetical protein